MRKKKVCIYMIFVLININYLFAQDSVKYNRDSVHKYFIVNFVPDQYNKTLNGIINIAKGSHESFHIGTIANYNQKNFKGFQLGCLNIVRGNLMGAQVAFINSCFDTLKGIQVGLINIAKVNKGVQVGVINYSDTASKHTSIAVVSIYRRGSYQAIEFLLAEMLPINVSVKTGLLAHSTLNFSSDSDFRTMYFGGGISIIRQLSNRWFFNPELSLESRIGKPGNLLSGCPKLTFKIHKRIFISAGPSVVWNQARERDLTTPLYYLYERNSDNGKNKLVIGYRVGIRFNFTTNFIKKIIKIIEE